MPAAASDRHRRSRRSIGILLALALTPSAAIGQSTGIAAGRSGGPNKATSERRHAEASARSEIESGRQEETRLARQLVETGKKVQESEAKLTALESRLGTLAEQEERLRAVLVRRHTTIARMLAAMQRMGRNPPPVMITRREDALQMVRSAMLVAAVFPELSGQALALARQLDGLAKVMADVRSEREKLKTETAQLTASQTELVGLMASKRKVLAAHQGTLDKVRNEAVEISRTVVELPELISRVGNAIERHVEAEPALRGPIPDSPATAIPAAASPPPPSPQATSPPQAAQDPPSPGKAPAVIAALPQPATPTAPPVIELAPSATRGTSASPGMLMPAVPFTQLKGRLQRPASGRKVIAFGDRSQYGSQSAGVVFETRPGALVTAPADGRVIFSGEFRSYGQLLIINGGDGYTILIAGLSQIDVQSGQFVLAGEAVGLMSGPPRGGRNSLPDSAPLLYVELRKDNRPIDPESWWASGGTGKGQG